MRNLVLYFSATGNTERMAGIVKAELERAGQEVLVRRIPEPIANADIAGVDRVIVAFPVLGKAPPVFVQRFLRRLPRASSPNLTGVSLAVDARGGGPAALRAAGILRRRGYRVEACARVSYPENWAQIGAVPRDEATAAAFLVKGDQRARELGAELARGEGRVERESAGSWAVGAVMAFLFDAFGRRFMGKMFAADARCTACGLCARSCPAGTILVGKRRGARPFWRMNCENCNRCINICPSRAIRTSLLGTILQFASIGLVIVMMLWIVNTWLWPLIGSGLAAALGAVWTSALRAALVVAAVLGAHFLAIGPVDFFVLRWLRKLPGLRDAFAIPFSRREARYTAPGFRP
jgi:ferredoxin